MPIDASIIGQIQPAANPLAQYAQLAQLQNMQTQGRLADIQVQGAQRAQERQNKLSQLLSGDYATPDAREQALLRGGFADESLKLGKDRRDNLKTDADTADKKFDVVKKKLEIAGQAFGYVRNNPTPEAAFQTLQFLTENGIYTPEQAEKYRAQITQNPMMVGELANQAFQSVLSAKDQLSTYQTRNTGGTTDTIGINPVTGKANVVNSVKNTQSPDSIASNATAMRGQNMTDARAREGQQMTLTKPFEITGEDGRPVLVQQDKQGNIKPVQGYTPKQGASKPLTEGQSKALLFGSRMQESGAILDELAANGTTKSIPGSRAPIVGRAVTAMGGENNQKLEQAKRDFINATLRRESGAVIADSEFDNAEKQYFPQIGDSPAVIAQKKRNREVATRGILAEVPDSENRVNKVRGGGGATGDFSKTSPNIDALLDKYK